MLGVTIGIGPGWRECAEGAAKAMSRHTNLECLVVSECPSGWEIGSPAWLKLWLQDKFPNQDLMIFDADMISIQPWNPVAQLGNYDMVWVADRSPQVLTECFKRRLDPTKYCNSGLILIRAGCSILQQTQKRYPDPSAWYEQTAINLTVQSEHGFRVRLMPNKYNVIVRRHLHLKATTSTYRQAYNLHFVGLSNTSERLEAISKLQEHFSCI